MKLGHYCSALGAVCLLLMGGASASKIVSCRGQWPILEYLKTISAVSQSDYFIDTFCPLT